MALKSYEEFAAEPLQFPLKDKLYTCPPLSIQGGITLAGITKGTGTLSPDDEPTELWKLMLGTAFDEMVADDVPADFLARAGLTALADYQYGRDIAESTWEAGADPNLLAALVIQKAAAQGNRASRRSSSTAGAKKTPSRARTKATTSPSI